MVINIVLLVIVWQTIIFFQQMHWLHNINCIGLDWTRSSVSIVGLLAARGVSTDSGHLNGETILHNIWIILSRLWNLRIFNNFPITNLSNIIICIHCLVVKESSLDFQLHASDYVITCLGNLRSGENELHQCNVMTEIVSYSFACFMWNYGNP